MLPDNVFVLLILALGVTPAAVHDAGVYVGRAGRVGFVEQGDDRQQHCADRLRGVPALARQLSRLRIVYGRMQD